MEAKYDHFFNWQLVLAVLHLTAAFLLAGTATHRDKDWSTQVRVTYNAWASANGTSCADGDGCVIFSAQETLDGNVSLIWATASASIISGLHHLFAFVFKDSYKTKCIDTNVNFARWLDYAGSSAIMFAIISILFTSPPDLYTLSLAFVSQFLVIIAGSGSEALWASSKGDREDVRSYSRLIFGVTFAAYLVPWVVLYVIFDMAIRADVTEDSCGVPFAGGAEKQDPPDFVWAAVIGLVVTFTTFAGVHATKIRGGEKKVNDANRSLRFEYAYSFLSFTSKIVLLANIGGGVLGRSENNVTSANAPDSNTGGGSDGDTATVWMYFGTALIIAFVLGVALLWTAKSDGIFRETSAVGDKAAKRRTNNAPTNSLVF